MFGTRVGDDVGHSFVFGGGAGALGVCVLVQAACGCAVLGLRLYLLFSLVVAAQLLYAVAPFV